ncbi:MAG: zinc ribbon domain-containing protein [Eubacterium sp.]|nr:zinc ribbon domain-containing protein [Eubacterium sp.]
MFCPQCGTRLPDDSVFCPNCGTRLAEAPVEQVQEQAQEFVNTETPVRPAAPVPPVNQVRQETASQEQPGQMDPAARRRRVLEEMRAQQTQQTPRQNAQPQQKQQSVQQQQQRQPQGGTQQQRQPQSGTQQQRQPQSGTQQQRQPQGGTQQRQQQPGTQQQRQPQGGTRQQRQPQPGTQQQRQPQRRTQPAGTNSNTGTKPGGKKAAIAIVAVIIIVAAVIGVFFFMSNRKTVINLNDYLRVSVNGSNGSGTASYTIDYDRLISENADAFRVTDKNRDKLNEKVLGVSTSGYGQWGNLANELIGSLTDDTEMVKSLLSGSGYYSSSGSGAVQGSLSKTSGIYNGDIIYYNWTIDDSAVGDIFKVAFSYSNMEYEIQGLY